VRPSKCIRQFPALGRRLDLFPPRGGGGGGLERPGTDPARHSLTVNGFYLSLPRKGRGPALPPPTCLTEECRHLVEDWKSFCAWACVSSVFLRSFSNSTRKIMSITGSSTMGKRFAKKIIKMINLKSKSKGAKKLNDL